MTDRSTIQQVAQLMADVAANLNEAIVQPVIEATQGYRAQMEQAGFSPRIAEQLAAAYHAELLKYLFARMTVQK